MQPYDLYALCIDDLDGIGFAYTPVYRVESGRIRVAGEVLRGTA